MDRRQALLGIAAMLGSSLLPPIRAAIAAGMDPVRMTGGTLFDDRLSADTAALAEVIIPTTDTPGAAQAGVAQFIEFMLQYWYPETDRQRYLGSMSQLASHCDEQHGAAFSELAPTEQVALVTRLQNGEVTGMDDGGKALFEHAKQLTLFGYYTSETGMTVERHYLPVPGRYDGAYPYDKVNTLFTS